MKHYSNDEVDKKIQAFLSKKLQKYPELVQSSDKKSSSADVSHTMKFIQSLTSHRQVASH